MGWNDRSPHAERIAAIQEEIEMEEGLVYPASYMRALSIYTEDFFFSETPFGE